MALVSGSVKSLVNGVSQQPAWVRLTSQGEVQENALSSLVEGVTKRPPSEHIARIKSSTFGNAFFHVINRDSNNRFAVVIVDDDLFVYDILTGTQKTVSFPDGKAYLNSASPSTGFACTTINDFTFVINRGFIVQATNAGNTADNSMWVHVKQAFYNCTYGVYVGGTLVASYTTAATGAQPATDFITGELVTALVASLGGGGYTITQFNNVIRVQAPGNAVDTIDATDSQGGSAMVAWSRSIQNFTDLPPSTFDGHVAEVRGGSANSFDSYWVEFDAGQNTWVEIVKPEDRERPNPVTMPYKLVHNADGTFTFAKIEWGWRDSGDAISNPTPTIVGRTINDLYIHRNRLFFLADQQVVGSRPGGENYFELYASTATTLLDSDPIDIGLPSLGPEVPIARHAIGFADDLLIFTNPGQIRLGAAESMTSATVKTTAAASYSASLRAKPVANGQLIHFAIEKGENSGIREGFIDTSTATLSAPEITVHVPSYITGEITHLISAINYDTLFVLADGAPNTVWLYKWYIENDEKKQSAWSSWVFPTGTSVLSGGYMDGSVYLLLERSTGVFIERVRLDSAHVDTGLSFSARLDRKAIVTGTYDAGNDWTTWTIPYDITGLTMVGVYGSSFTGRAGFQMPTLTVVNASAGTVRLAGNWSAGSCIFGVRYTYTYELSTIYLPDDRKPGSFVTEGRLQLKNVIFNYMDTGYFRVSVTVEGRDPITYTFTPNVVGQSLVVGTPQLKTGQFRVPVQGRNTASTIQITSDSHYPCSILSFDWEGEFTMRSRRV